MKCKCEYSLTPAGYIRRTRSDCEIHKPRTVRVIPLKDDVSPVPKHPQPEEY